MKIGANTYPYLWKGSIADAFRALHEIGIKEAEILVSPPQMWVRKLDSKAKKEIEQTIEETGIRILALNPPGQDINLASPNPDMRAFTVAQYRELIDLAAEWNVPYIVMPPGKLHPLLPPDFEWVWKECKPSFEELIEHAEMKNVTLLIENIPSLFLQSSEEILWAINDLKSDHFAAIYDVANGFMVEDPSKGIQTLGEHIRLVHLSDTKKSKWEHNVIGTGDIDFKQVLDALNNINYTGTCLLEIIHSSASKGIIDSMEQLKILGWELDE